MGITYLEGLLHKYSSSSQHEEHTLNAVLLGSIEACDDTHDYDRNDIFTALDTVSAIGKILVAKQAANLQNEGMLRTLDTYAKERNLRMLGSYLFFISKIDTKKHKAE